METIDYVVLFGYFAGMAAIGVWAMKRVKGQEDYFMGGRRFGKLFQTFAAFGAGTGSADPVNTARGTFANGMSGMWGVMYWLFVTPIYWISAVWYRRMRCLTLGDWFAERYQSKKMGVAYAIFGCFYYMVYGRCSSRRSERYPYRSSAPSFSEYKPNTSWSRSWPSS